MIGEPWKRSEFQVKMDLLEAERCRPCHGSGTVNDAECGDISFNTYVCGACNGTGFDPASRRNEPTCATPA